MDLKDFSLNFKFIKLGLAFNFKLQKFTNLEVFQYFSFKIYKIFIDSS